MKRLPNIEHAIVDERKILEYLLAEDHPFGRTKARFFRRLGFARSDWEVLRDALLAHARLNPVLSRESTAFGLKYVIEGPLRGLDGRTPVVRTV